MVDAGFLAAFAPSKEVDDEKRLAAARVRDGRG
jgi:hypothetical protein